MATFNDKHWFYDQKSKTTTTKCTNKYLKPTRQ